MPISSVRIFTSPLHIALEPMFVIIGTLEVSFKDKDQEEGDSTGHVIVIKTFYWAH